METDSDMLALILAAEGSTFTDDPLDAGGPTRWGITLAVLSEWRERHTSAADVANLERAEAEAIYRARYIKPFDMLPDGLRQNVVDMGVNAGVSRAARLCQQLVGAKVDGVIGPATAREAGSRDWTALYSVMRIAFYESLIERKPSQIRYRNGWRNRAMRFMAPTPTYAIRGVLGALMSSRVGKAYE